MEVKMLESLRVLCLIPCAALSLAGPATAQTTGGAPAASMPHAAMQKGSGAAHDMKQSMMKGMGDMEKMPMSGDVDKDFAMMMKMHHQQAVDMAQMELAHGKSPAMKKMATQIIASQKKEIAQFDQFLAQHK